MSSANHDSGLILSPHAPADGTPDDIPLLDLNSTGPWPIAVTGPGKDAATDSAHQRRTANSAPVSRAFGSDPSIWLDGDVAMCACPECGAPTSIRIWLMVADCWQCGTSIQLTEKQEREVDRLLQARAKAGGTASTKTRAPTRPTAASPAAMVGVEARKKSAPVDRPERTADGGHRGTVARPGRTATAAQMSRAAAEVRRRAAMGATRVWWYGLFRDLPAWLISGLVHLILLMLLGLWMLSHTEHEPTIVLSAEIDKSRREGGIEDEFETQAEVNFDLPVPAEDAPQNESQRQALIAANQEARELRVNPDTLESQLPDLYQVKSTIASGNPMRAMVAVRDPRLRVEMIKKEGGTTLTEAAVARALRWISQHQNEDGSWSLDRFQHAPECAGQCDGAAKIRSTSAGTSLVLLPFLGAGQTHLVGRYKDTVAAGLRWMVEHQEPNGDLRYDSAANSGMYAQGQSAIVLCEAFAMTGDEYLRRPAQLAIDFIIAAQHPGGGWRYHPQEAGDTSVLGWQVMALQSARAAQLNVPPLTVELANQYLDAAQQEGGSQYAYQPGGPATHVMTAEGLLCRMYLGWNLQNPSLRPGVTYLLDHHPPQQDRPEFYYWYYATQVMHHAGGSQWEQWNLRMRQALIQSQETRGHQAGSWAPRGVHAEGGGRIYTTSLAACTLEVYYRHAPIFRQIKLD